MICLAACVAVLAGSANCTPFFDTSFDGDFSEPDYCIACGDNYPDCELRCQLNCITACQLNRPCEDGDEETETYRDTDGDTFGDLTSRLVICGTQEVPEGYTTNSNDCDDTDENINPNATELVGDGVDQDCDGEEICLEDSDNDGWGRELERVSSNIACDGLSEALARGTPPQYDCGDATGSCAEDCYPGLAEICDGIDNDCNDSVDDGLDSCNLPGQPCEDDTECTTGSCLGPAGSEGFCGLSEPTCRQYCELMMDACTGANQRFPSVQACGTVCEEALAGQMVIGAYSDELHSVGCRTRLAAIARFAGPAMTSARCEEADLRIGGQCGTHINVGDCVRGSSTGPFCPAGEFCEQINGYGLCMPGCPDGDSAGCPDILPGADGRCLVGSDPDNPDLCIYRCETDADCGDGRRCACLIPGSSFNYCTEDVGDLPDCTPP